MEGLSALFRNFAEILTPLVEFLIWSFPFKIYRLHDGERGVILTFGKVRRKKAERGPGITICFMFEDLDSVQAVNGFIDFGEQNIQTSDGKVMVANGAVTYDVFNFQKAMLETESIEDLVSGISLNEMREYARLNSLDDIIDSEKLTSGIATKINRRLRKHGVKVASFMLTDLRPHDMTMLCDAIRDSFSKQSISSHLSS